MGSDLYLETLNSHYDDRERNFRYGFCSGIDVSIRNFLRLTKEGKSIEEIIEHLDNLRKNPPSQNS